METCVSELVDTSHLGFPGQHGGLALEKRDILGHTGQLNIIKLEEEGAFIELKRCLY